ncbi:MAG: hypothetical protein JXB05_04300 [Myxococcaceae bacterium]|nr:hypothetical protein [Myxococcaceae bacterium]
MSTESRLIIETTTQTPSDMGFGYDSLAYDTVGNTAFSIGDNPIDKERAPAGRLQLRVARSAEDLTRTLDFFANAQGAMLGAKMEGTLKFLQNTTFKANNVYVVALVDVTSEIKTLRDDKIRLRGEAAGMDALAFYKRFGDYYLKRLVQGGFLSIFLTMEAADTEAKNDFTSSVEAKEGSWEGTASGKVQFSANLRDILKRGRFEVSARHLGGAGPPQDIFSDDQDKAVDALMKYILGFEQDVRDNSAICKAEYWRYADFVGVPRGLHELTTPPTRRLSELSTLAQKYTDVTAHITQALDESDDLGLSDSNRSKLKDLRDHALKDQRAVKDCWRHDDPKDIPSPEELEKGKKIDHPADWYWRKLKDFQLDERIRVRYGGSFYLKFQDGRHLSNSKDEWPRLARGGPIKVQFAHGEGEVKQTDRLALRTKESGKYQDDVLSGSSSHKDLFWQKPDKSNNSQDWTLVKKKEGDISDRFIRYGDRVFIESLRWTGQRIKDDGDWLTTKKPNDPDEDWWWRIERIPE